MMKKLTGILISSLFLISAAWAADDSLTDIETLGKRLYTDKNMSYNGTQSCQDCHHPFSGFADLSNHLDPVTNFVSTGADGVSKGGRNAPSSAYAGFSPILEKINGEWVGGMFWDGRADGSVLGDPLAEQAQGPPLNPVEMNMADKEAVIDEIAKSDYVDLWNTVFGEIPHGNLSPETVDEAYDNFGRAIAAYERSIDVTKFTSKYDTAMLDDTEQEGKALFHQNCASCHTMKKDFNAPAPLFTNYKYANLGVPANPEIPSVSPDLGIGTVVDDMAQEGKFKIPTLRNIALTAPYSHNGVFPTLMEMLEFLNKRDDSEAEVSYNLSTKVGDLGLTRNQLKKIEAFLMTLTDDY